MKLFEKRLGLCLVALFIIGCNHGKGGSMQEFKGVYFGFAPTDESAVGLGELEVTISDTKIKARMATGLKIEDDDLLVSNLQPMTSEEVTAEFRPGSPLASRVVGFRAGSGHPILLFFKNPTDDEFGLLVRTGGIVEEAFGPELLYSPAQVARGCFEKAISNIEQAAGKGVVPRLRSDGKAEGSGQRSF